jgi:hypothetical protein
MAPTTDTQCLRFRAVFVEREPARAGVDLTDLESAVTQLDALFKVAWAISDPETLRLEAEFRRRFPHGSGGEALVLRRFPPSVPAPLPILRSLAMQSPIDLLAEIPGEFLWGGGAVAALGVLVERVLDFPLRIQVKREKASCGEGGMGSGANAERASRDCPASGGAEGFGRRKPRDPERGTARLRRRSASRRVREVGPDPRHGRRTFVMDEHERHSRDAVSGQAPRYRNARHPAAIWPRPGDLPLLGQRGH